MRVRTSSLPSSSVAITETEPLALSESLTLIDLVSPTFLSVAVVPLWLSESVNLSTFSLRITVACTESPDCSN